MTTMTNMTVGDLAHMNTATTEVTATLREAAADLAGEYKGMLVVSGPKGLIGVISERDIIRAIGEGEDPDAMRVEEMMVTDLVTIAPGGTVQDAIALMDANEIRHLVVMEGDEYRGILSMRDLTQALLGVVKL